MHESANYKLTVSPHLFQQNLVQGLPHLIKFFQFAYVTSELNMGQNNAAGIFSKKHTRNSNRQGNLFSLSTQNDQILITLCMVDQ